MKISKRDVLELKKRFKKDKCTFTNVCGCYVTGEKNILFKFRENFLNLEDDEFFKYLEIAKKVFSGTLGNNLLELEFELDKDLKNIKQLELLELKRSRLKDDKILESFYQSIIDNYRYEGNFLILLFHDAYDIITKTTDNMKMDESEDVYEYVVTAICPVSLSKPGLRCFEEENTIKARIRDWVVEAPSDGFVYPAFIDRNTDVNSVMYYSKNTKELQEKIIENTLGCPTKLTASIQKEIFSNTLINSLDTTELESSRILIDVQNNFSNLIEEHKEAYEGTDAEPLVLTKEIIYEVLEDSGVSSDIIGKIESKYEISFEDEEPLLENLIDSKILKESEQKKKERELQTKIEILEKKLEISNEDDCDVVVKTMKEVGEIETRIIEGRKYLMIPIKDEYRSNINGEIIEN